MTERHPADIIGEIAQAFAPPWRETHPHLFAPKWQPIETAPAEGEFLGFDPSVETIGAIAVISRCGSKFAVIHDREDYAWSDYTPTHWLPLPEPPLQHTNWYDAKGMYAPQPPIA